MQEVIKLQRLLLSLGIWKLDGNQTIAYGFYKIDLIKFKKFLLIK